MTDWIFHKIISNAHTTNFSKPLQGTEALLVNNFQHPFTRNSPVKKDGFLLIQQKMHHFKISSENYVIKAVLQ